MQLYLYHFVELLCATLAIGSFRFLRAHRLVLLLPFLLFITLAEYIAILQHTIYHTSTYGTNYLIMLVEWIFYNYLFLRFTRLKTFRQYIRWSLPIGAACIVGGYYFFPGQYSVFFYCIILAGFFLSVAALGYLFTRFTEDEVTDLTQDPVGWVAVGVVVFFSGVSIVFSLYEFIQLKRITLWGEPIYTLVPRLLSLFLYSCISIAIITCRRIIPSLSAS
ncbi:MAG: hypothetical protein ACK46Z_09110 [Bacteroidota bacterium]|jgi:hypothetical protein